MCQLTLINFHNKSINIKQAFNQAYINTEIRNRDGFGVWQDKRINRVVTYPAQTDYFGEVITKVIVDDAPILMHCRAASMLYTKKELNMVDTHPFEGENIILAHNGTLEYEDIKDHPEYTDMIDSEIFMMELDKVWNSDDPVKSLNDTMLHFTGKFAFLITDKKNGKLYVVRGLSADLCISYLLGKDDVRLGYIVNTEEVSLKESMKRLTSELVLSGKRYRYVVPKELEKETIYEATEDDVVEIGKIKQRTKPVAVTIYSSGVTIVGNTLWDKLGREYLYLGISIPELDKMFYYLFHKGITSVSYNEISSFLTDVCPVLDKYTSTAKEKIWHQITKQIGIDKAYELVEFPFIVNDTNYLQKVLLDLKYETKK